MKNRSIMLLILASVTLNIDLSDLISVVNPVADAAAENIRGEETKFASNPSPSSTAQSGVTTELATPAPSPPSAVADSSAPACATISDASRTKKAIGGAVAKAVGNCRYSDASGGKRSAQTPHYRRNIDTFEPSRVFTVRDSIEMARIVNAGANGDAGFPFDAHFSPDGKHFLVHTRKGDLAQNVNVETLWLFEVNDVRAYLSGSAPLPTPRKLVEINVADDPGALASVRWLNRREVAFIGQDRTGPAQVFKVDIASGTRIQLTRELTTVTSFALQDEHLLYYALVPQVIQQVRNVEKQSPGELIKPNFDPAYPIVNLMAANLKTGAHWRVNAPTMRLSLENQRIWISPSGRYAITFAPATNAPAYWAQYDIPDYGLFGYTADRVSIDATSKDLMFRVRYQLVDLVNNSVAPLLDAPTGTLAINYSAQEAFWLKDGASVVVTNTFLPIGSKGDDARRRRYPATAEINVASGRIETIAWEPVRQPDANSKANAGPGLLPERVLKVEWLADVSRLVRTKRKADGEQVTETLEKARHWRRLAQSNRASAVPQLTISLDQALNERPKVNATDGECGCRKLLFDPNPQADRFTFGHVDTFRWTDANGIDWQGGLILPPDYTPKRRYPLVVQSHGFQKGEFLLDGPGGTTTAFAAQPLANAGFVVLQVEDNPRVGIAHAHEGDRYAVGLRAGIDRLIASGLADPAHVGYIGWSATGFHALYLMAKNPKLLAAMTISDSAQPSYISHMLNVNHVRDLTAQMDKMTGGAPRIGHLDDWMSGNPLYQLNAVDTPVRFEAIGLSSLMHMWESYALLRYAKRPVDMIYFPEGSHTLMKPAERLASQGGNVDWFRFWLQGVEDHDVSKAEQYARWRGMRDAAAVTVGRGS